MLYLYAGFLLLMNLLGFGLMWADKQFARRGMWRISERMLFGTACLGGCLGAFLGMKLFRHKTKHLLFSLGLPLLLVVYVLLTCLLFALDVF